MKKLIFILLSIVFCGCVTDASVVSFEGTVIKCDTIYNYKVKRASDGTVMLFPSHMRYENGDKVRVLN